MIILTIILAIIAIFGFFFTTILRKAQDPEDHEVRKALAGLRMGIVIVCAIIFLIAVLINGIKIIDQTEIGVVKIFGKVDHTISSGLNFLNPFTEKVVKMDLRIHVKESSFASYTKDAQPVTASVEYQYELSAENAMMVATQYGSFEVLENKLGAAAEERAKIVFSRYGAMTLLENRSTLSAQVWDEFKELEALFPIHFTNVVIKDIDFSDAFEAAVEAKMEAEQNALRAENEKQEAITRAEQAKEVARINAEAAVEVAKGEAEALAITRDALANMPDTYIQSLYLEKWDGKLPQFITGDGANLMIAPDLD